MSSRSLNQLRPLFRLPPHLRQQLYAQSLYHQPTRTFHASPSHHLGLETLASLPHHLLLTLHSTGLPWSTVIPLTALLIRATITTTLTIPSHNALKRRLALAPLFTGLQRSAQQSPKYLKLRDLEFRAQMSSLRKQLLRKWKAQSWRLSLPWLQFPVFVVFMETLRAMGGSGVGFFGALWKRVLGGGATEQGGDVEGEEPLGGGHLGLQETAPRIFERDEWLEPSFRTEGLSWCTDLTVPDPTGILPVLAPALLLSNLVISTGLWRDPKRVLGTRSGRIVLTAGGALTVLLWSSAPLMPAGLLYYWACSSSVALATNLWIDLRDPVLRVTPTKRAVQIGQVRSPF